MDGEHPDDREPLGRSAENRALAHLRDAGLVLVARNFRTRHGEIDLIMRDRGMVVFVEVRQRSSARFGTAAESVTAAKRRRLHAAAGAWLAWHPAARGALTRFDLVAIDGDPRAPTALQWHKGALGAD